jgi:hypothetical protein
MDEQGVQAPFNFVAMKVQEKIKVNKETLIDILMLVILVTAGVLLAIII